MSHMFKLIVLPLLCLLFYYVYALSQVLLILFAQNYANVCAMLTSRIT